MKLQRFALLILLGLAGSANAANMVIDQFFSNLKTFSADFIQKIDNPQLGMAAESTGKMIILRPGKFYWEYQSPYAQKIVADGKKIWVYDEDLEQVTIKPMDETLGQTPALLLSQETPIEQSFSISKSYEREGLKWVELTPLNDDAGFSMIALGFLNRSLAIMEIKDQLGQATRMEFKRSKRNGHVNKKLFQFTAPKGVDIFDQTAQ